MVLEYEKKKKMYSNRERKEPSGKGKRYFLYYLEFKFRRNFKENGIGIGSLHCLLLDKLLEQ